MKPGKIALLAAVVFLIGAGYMLSSREESPESGAETLAHAATASDADETAGTFAVTRVAGAEGPITVYAAPT